MGGGPVNLCLKVKWSESWISRNLSTKVMCVICVCARTHARTVGLRVFCVVCVHSLSLSLCECVFVCVCALWLQVHVGV